MSEVTHYYHTRGGFDSEKSLCDGNPDEPDTDMLDEVTCPDCIALLFCDELKDVKLIAMVAAPLVAHYAEEENGNMCAEVVNFAVLDAMHIISTAKRCSQWRMEEKP